MASDDDHDAPATPPDVRWLREEAARAALSAGSAGKRLRRLADETRDLAQALAHTTAELVEARAARLRANAALRRARTTTPAPAPTSLREILRLQADAFAINRSGLFEPRWYLARLGPGAVRGDPLDHYLRDGWRAGLDPSPYFHTRFYLAQHPDVARTGVCPLVHYIRSGARERRAPHPLFDPDWYLAQCPEAHGAHDVLAHFRLVGAARGCDPHPMFSTAYYLRRHEDLNALGPGGAFDHFLRAGGAEGRTPHPLFDPDFYARQEGAGADEENLLIDFLMAPTEENRQPHGAFDTAWYRARHADARGPRTVAAVHYLREGERRGLRPNPLFDPDWYAEETDGEIARGLLLAHYLETGSAKGLRPHPLFDPRYYARHAVHAPMEALAHFLTEGGARGFPPHPLFDARWYLATYPSVAAQGLNPLAHYLETGARLGLKPNRIFDPFHYSESNPDVRTTGLEALSHYAVSGEEEGRTPAPLFDPAYMRRTGQRVATLGAYLADAGRPPVSTHRLFAAAFYVARYPDVLESGLDPLAHFIEIGAAELRDCCPLFDAAWYAGSYANEIQPGVDPLTDYLRGGWKKGRAPNRYFDPQWYADACRAAGLKIPADPLTHYIATGARLGVDPHPLFDARWYARRTPAARKAPGGALGHFLHVGDRTDLAPNALFDAAWYRAANNVPPDTGAFRHYIETGALQRARPTPLFDPEFYLRTAPDPPKAADALSHYIHQGERAGLKPNPYFDPVEYGVRAARRARKPATPPPARTPWRRDAAYGAPASRTYACLVAFPWELASARAQAAALKRHGLTIRLTLLDTPEDVLSAADEAFDEIREISELNLPDLKAWLFARTRADVVDAVRLRALDELLARPDCAGVLCLPVAGVDAHIAPDLLAPLDKASLCLPYAAAKNGAPVFALRADRNGAAFVRRMEELGLERALAAAPLESDGVHVLAGRCLGEAQAVDPAVTWRYDFFDNGAPITDGLRALYRDDPLLRTRFPDPFAIDEAGGFFGWAAGVDAWRGTRVAGRSFRHDTRLAHFIELGDALGLAPAPWFDAHAYTSRYEDVAAGALHPFAHYVVFGAREGREARPAG